MKKPRLLLADDHPILVEGLKALLKPEFDVVATAGDGKAVLEAAEKHQPELILLDISMPGLNGIEAARRLKQTNPGAKLIILTMHGELSFVRAAFKAGVSGYLLKHSAPTELVTALHDVDHGDRYISSLIPNRLGTRIPGFRRRSKKLSEDDSPAIADPPKYSKRGRKSMGAEERMQVSERMTRYWAGRRRQ